VARFGYSFPAIRGVQAGRAFFASMVPLRLIPKIFVYDEEELMPELRAQRTLNRARIPEIARYILDNPANYVFSALTASIDGEIQFTPFDGGTDTVLGTLEVDMRARFLINDGQHRRAAIEAALKERPELADETISVVFFLDLGLSRAQQMFADLNRHAIRPSKSLGVLYDHRDDKAGLVRTFILRSPVFRGLVEMEKTTLAMRSSKLFTLSAIYSATNELLEDMVDLSAQQQAELATKFWEATSLQFLEWNLVRERRMTAGDVRQDFIHSHGIVLTALGRAGSTLIATHPDDWPKRLEALSTVNWQRSNSELWEGRALVGGHVSKARQNVALTTNVVKRALGLELSADELRHEHAFTRGVHEAAH
jgi:DNA sulfur modification protein DndB